MGLGYTWHLGNCNIQALGTAPVQVLRLTNDDLLYSFRGADTQRDRWQRTRSEPAGDAIIEWAMPWSFFTDDPLSMGFPKTTAADNKLTLRLSQTFGYSVAGGSSFGADRLGSVYYEAAAVPEPSSLLLALTVLFGAGVAVRRKR